MNYLEVIEKAIRDINGIHEELSESYFTNEFESINLKKHRIETVISSDGIKPVFLEYLHEYQTSLNTVMACSDFEYDYEDNDGRIRVKQRESVQNKLLYYYKTNSDGKIPLQKCLNDLLGFRLIFEDFDSSTLEFEEMMNRLKNELSLMKWYSRDDGSYKATHVYFKNGNNIYFPWELQIWNSHDSDANETSHAEHKAKRNYINWPKQYVEGDLREENK